MDVILIHPQKYLHSIPCLSNLLVALMEAGIKITVFYDESLVDESCSRIDARLRSVNLPRLAGAGIGLRIREVLEWRRIVEATVNLDRLSAIIASEPIGLIVANGLRLNGRTPLYYLSLEILFWPELKRMSLLLLKAAECLAIRKAQAVIVQDVDRAYALTHSTFWKGKVLELPNAWRDNIIDDLCGSAKMRPVGEIVLVHAGSITPWTMALKVVESSGKWPKGFRIRMHSREMSSANPLPVALRDAISRGRVQFSEGCQSTFEYMRMLREAHFGLALYEPQPGPMTNRNLKYVGKSSGKLAAYLMVGLPVVVNASTNLAELVDRYRCGVVVDHLDEIPCAVQNALPRYDELARAAKHCYANEFSPEKFVPAVVADILTCSR